MQSGSYDAQFTFGVDSCLLFLVAKLLVNCPNLLIEIEGMELIDMSVALSIRIAIITVQRHLLSSSLLFL